MNEKLELFHIKIEIFKKKLAIFSILNYNDVMKSKENTKIVKKRRKNLCKVIDIKEAKRNNTLDTRHSTLDTRHSTLDTRHSTLGLDLSLKGQNPCIQKITTISKKNTESVLYKNLLPYFFINKYFHREERL